MRYIYSIWKGKNIWFNPLTGQFETDNGYSSYVESHVRLAAINGF